MDMELNQLIQDKEGKSIVCKNAKDAMKIIQIIENATLRYRRIFGASPDKRQLKMPEWTVLDPDTKLELTRDRMDQPQSMVEGKLVYHAYAHTVRSRLYWSARLQTLPWGSLT